MGLTSEDAVLLQGVHERAVHTAVKGRTHTGDCGRLAVLLDVHLQSESVNSLSAAHHDSQSKATECKPTVQHCGLVKLGGGGGGTSK